ncbi:unnamed protein product, partial [marine sediment metagenome]
ILKAIPINLLFILLLLGIAANASETASEKAAGASIVNVYNTSENSVERRTALRSLNDVVSRGEKTPQWVRGLLESALDDKSPVVVDVAVYQIGNFGLAGFSSKLITLYSDVKKKYSSAYARRVRYSIVSALGKTGGKSASLFLSNLLAEDNGTAMGQFLLLAIKDLNDPTLLKGVKQYQTKMEGLVKFAKAKNYDPLIYSRKLMYVNLALDVEKSLVLRGGK